MALFLLFMLPLSFMFLLILFSSHCFNGEKSNKLLRLPPGSTGWPFIGETISFMQPHPSSCIGDFIDSHINMYGKIFRMNLLGKPTIVSADPDFNRFILQSEGKAFENSCPASMKEIMGRCSMLSLAGDAHREMRNIAVSFLCNARLKEYFLGAAEQETVRVLRSWEGRMSSFSAHEEGGKFAFNLMVKHLMSMDEGEGTEHLRKEYKSFMKGMASLPLNLPGTAYRKAIKSRAKILKIIGQKLEERVKKLRENSMTTEEEQDFLTLALREHNITRDQALDLMLSVLFAGHETSSAAISLAIYFLGSCPQALEQLQKEHMRIAQSKEEKVERGLNWDDYKQMDFTHCVIQETLRLGNIVKFLYRRAIKDIEYKGYDIPSGWQVVPIISAAHLDPSLYEEPQRFNPWRWLDITASGATSLVTFSGGPRLCPGAELAKVEMAVFLHHLVLKFNWKLADDDYPVSYPFLGFSKGLPIEINHVHVCRQ